jgi:hypothetical protein
MREQESGVIHELAEAFSTLFVVRPLRTYGTAKKQHQGFTDGREGVQWNAGIDRERDVLTLGTNLEGMAYDGWPIARLIERELARPRFVELVTAPALGACELWFTRDAWQAAARLPIKEQHLTPDIPQLVASVDEGSWRSVLLAAQACLDPRRNHRGRRREEVTLLASGATVLKDVSPHLQIKCVLDAATTASGAEIMSALQAARETLAPVHRWMVEQSRP